MNYLSIDRIEGKVAVCIDDNDKIVKISILDLPENAQEGSVIYLKNGLYYLDNAEQKRRKDEMLELQAKIFKKKSSQ